MSYLVLGLSQRLKLDIFLRREVKHNLSATSGACRSESEGHLVVLLKSFWFFLMVFLLLLCTWLADAWL